jgi:hypothetical protein
MKEEKATSNDHHKENVFLLPIHPVTWTSKSRKVYYAVFPFFYSRPSSSKCTYPIPNPESTFLSYVNKIEHSLLKEQILSRHDFSFYFTLEMQTKSWDRFKGGKTKTNWESIILFLGFFLGGKKKEKETLFFNLIYVGGGESRKKALNTNH